MGSSSTGNTLGDERPAYRLSSLAASAVAAIVSVSLVASVGLMWYSESSSLRLVDRYPKDLFTSSAFDMALYQSQQHEPYRSYPCVPRRVHISQASDVDVRSGKVAMTISFTLDRQTCSRATPTIVYGRGYRTEGTQTANVAEDRLNFDFRSEKLPTYQKYRSDWIFHMRISGLQAGTELYWYQILVKSDTPRSAFGGYVFRGRQEHSGESPEYVLRTPPFPGSGPTNLALVGDVGQTENSTKTFNHILAATNQLENPVSMLLLPGDLSYADSDPYRWDSWMDLMEPLLRTTPMSTVPGNHEIECDSSSHQVFTPFEHFFRNPNRVAPADRRPVKFWRRAFHLQKCTPAYGGFIGHYNYGNAFYSFVHGLAHIISLNSYTDCTVGSVQYQWLAKALQKVDRRVTPWLLVQFHNPLHTSFTSHMGERNSRLMLENMEPLFVKYGVNIVLSGHDHAFLRTHHMIGGKLDPTQRGPVYFTIGSGGNREQHTPGFIHDIPENWVAKRDNDEFGFGNLLLANATHAHFKWVRDGTTTAGIQDDVWLQNQHMHIHSSAMQ